MKRMNAAREKWAEEENIGFSIYGTPLESTTYKFAKCLQNRFGIIKGITDRNYITNSYHVHVTEKFLKLGLEFQLVKGINYIGTQYWIGRTQEIKDRALHL